MDAKTFCTKIADALNIGLKWRTNEDLKNCLNFKPDLNQPIILQSPDSNNIKLSFDCKPFACSLLMADIYICNLDRWFIINHWNDKSYTLQENLLNDDINYLFDGCKTLTPIINYLKTLCHENKEY